MGAKPSVPNTEEVRMLLGQHDEACKAAAAAIQQCDILILTTGAGFSADSGLKVYADVAKVPAWADAKITYSDLCQPHWIKYALYAARRSDTAHRVVGVRARVRVRVVFPPMHTHPFIYCCTPYRYNQHNR